MHKHGNSIYLMRDNMGLGISLFCFFSLLFFFPGIFFQPIMLNILLQAIYYAQDLAT